LLDESEVTQRKAFLRSFVKRIVVDKNVVKLHYSVPVPPDGKEMEKVLTIVPPPPPKVNIYKRTGNKKLKIKPQGRFKVYAIKETAFSMPYIPCTGTP